MSDANGSSFCLGWPPAPKLNPAAELAAAGLEGSLPPPIVGNEMSSSTAQPLPLPLVAGAGLKLGAVVLYGAPPVTMLANGSSVEKALEDAAG